MTLKLSNKQIKRIAKQIKAQEVLGQQEVEDITANAVNFILEEIHRYSGMGGDEFYSTLEKTDSGMEFWEKLSTAISSVVSTYSEKR